jgi:sugar/nucleoside kinase (ribokinase family)
MNGRDTLVTDLNVLADFDPILPESYKNSEYVMLGNLTPSVQMKVLDQLTVTPKLVVLDTMNFWMDIALDDLKKVLKRIDVLTINDEEARQLSGERSLLTAAKVIHAMGPKYLIIKKGEHGAMLFGEDQVFYAPALLLPQVTDPTGAGDTFAGGFMGYIVKSGDISFAGMKKAIIHGSAMASFCVERFSTEGLKNLKNRDITARVKQFAQMVKF